MRKRVFAVVLVVVMFCSALFFGCSSDGVPQSEFDELLEKYNAVVAERDRLSDDVKALQESQSSTPSSSNPSGSASSPSPAPSSSMTTGQKNALASAKSYLKYSAFSYTGLIEQLEFEKYSHEDAVYTADNCGADWFEQAALSAATYLNYSSFSKQGLIDQLMFEGFTREQATYGAEQNGY